MKTALSATPWDAARAAPGVYVERSPRPEHAGATLAVLADMRPNVLFPALEDGVYLEVFDYQGSGFLVDAHATSNGFSRGQFFPPLVKQFPTYEAAKAAALKWYAGASVLFASVTARTAKAKERIRAPGERCPQDEHEHCDLCGDVVVTKKRGVVICSRCA